MSLTDHPNIATRDSAFWARLAPVVVLAYLVLQGTIRVLVPGALGADEAEQIITAQSLEWGYGRQPPFYTWMQIAVFEITGPGKLGLVLWKYSLLIAIYLGVWTLSRQLGAGRVAAAFAILGVLLLPTIVWNTQRELTHLILVTATSVWTMIAVLATARQPRIDLFVLVGLLVGVGFLGKWNYAFVLVGLIGAGLLAHQMHHRMWLLSLAVALAVLAMPVWWALQNWGLTISATSAFEFNEDPARFASIGGLFEMAEGLLSELLLFALAFWLCVRTGRGTPHTVDWAQRLVERTVLIGLCCVGIGVLLSGATDFRTRWLLPLLIFVPVIAAIRFEHRMSEARLNWFFCGTGAIMAIMTVVFSLFMLRGDGEPIRQNTPFAAVAEASGLQDQTILAGSFFVGGNLLLVRPDLTVITPQASAMMSDATPTLAMWEYDRETFEAPSELLVALTAETTGADLNALPVATAEPNYPAPHAAQTYRFFWTELPQ